MTSVTVSSWTKIPSRHTRNWGRTVNTYTTPSYIKKEQYEIPRTRIWSMFGYKIRGNGHALALAPGRPFGEVQLVQRSAFTRRQRQTQRLRVRHPSTFIPHRSSVRCRAYPPRWPLQCSPPRPRDSSILKRKHTSTFS
jgi:hypothetical protein